MNEGLSVTHILLGLALSGLGGAFGLLYKDMRTRIFKLERKQSACLQLLTRVAIKTGSVDEQTIHDIQKAIQ